MKKFSVVSVTLAVLAVLFSAVLGTACLFPKKAEQVVNVAAERTMQAAEAATGAVVEFHPRLRDARKDLGLLRGVVADQASEIISLKDVSADQAGEIETLNTWNGRLTAELGTAVADGAEAMADASRWEGRYKASAERLARIRSLVQAAAAEDVVGQ